MLDTAETRSRDLARSAEAIWRERRRLIDDMRGIGEELVAIGDVEGTRFAKLTDEIPVAAAHPGKAGSGLLPAARAATPADSAQNKFAQPRSSSLWRDHDR
jgi:hypothetical protein